MVKSLRRAAGRAFLADAERLGAVLRAAAWVRPPILTATLDADPTDDRRVDHLAQSLDRQNR